MKSAAFNDRCSKCGDVIPDNAGCIQVRDYLCDDCCKAAGHQHPWHQKPQGRKQTVMKQWISPYYFGTRVIDGVMRLVRKVTAASQEEIVPDEDLVALDERGRARVGAHRKGTISRADVSNPEPTIANVAASLEPGCGQKFENSGARMMCNDHVHRPKPDLQPDPKAVLAPVAFRLQKPLGRPTEAGPDSNPSRGDTLSHFVPEVSPLQQARDAYAEGLA